MELKIEKNRIDNKKAQIPPKMPQLIEEL